jgi:hypothetical protein
VVLEPETKRLVEIDDIDVAVERGLAEVLVDSPSLCIFCSDADDAVCVKCATELSAEAERTFTESAGRSPSRPRA